LFIVICVLVCFVNRGRSGFLSALILAMSLEFAYLGVAAYIDATLFPFIHEEEFSRS
jgi:hypothetical protein